MERRPADAPVVHGGEPRTPSPAVPAATPRDRAVDADLLLDIPALTVEELSLELEASLLVHRVKVDAKGLEAGLFLKANLDGLPGLGTQGAPPARTPLRQRGPDMRRLRRGLRELLGAAGDADAPTVVHEPERGTPDAKGEGARRRNGNGDGGHRARERARHAVGQGAKAAGLTAAGLAGGALIESRVKPARKLPIPRRRGRVQVIRDEIARRLP